MLSDIAPKHDTSRPDVDTATDCISAALFAPPQLRRCRQVGCLPLTSDVTEVLTLKGPGGGVLPTLERFFEPSNFRDRFLIDLFDHREIDIDGKNYGRGV